MKRFKKILYLSDGRAFDGPAFQQAVELAEANRAHLTIIEVVEKIPPLTIRQTASLIRDVYLKERRRELVDVLATLEGRIQASQEILEGRGFQEAIREVLRGGHDLLIRPVASTKRGLKSLFGSTEKHLLRKCPCPLWLIHEGKRQRLNRIVAAVDFDDLSESDPNTRLNRQIIEMSMSLAVENESKLAVLHAWLPFLGGFALRAPTGMSARQMEQYFDEEKAAHQEKLNTLMEDAKDWVGSEIYQAVHPRKHLIKGTAARAILDYTRRADVDLLVMGTVGRGGIDGLLIGNTAEMVFEDIQCSVLALKPEGFVTPISLNG